MRQNISGRHIKELIQLLLLKFSTLSLTAYALLFLTFTGGLKTVGIYSTVTAVTAPVAMFLVFRNVEWISLSLDKAKAFSVATIVSTGGFLIAIPAIYLSLLHLVGDSVFLETILLFKPLEVLSDMVTIAYTATRNTKSALISTYARFTITIVSSIAFVYLFHISPLRGVAYSLLSAFFSVFIFYDINNLQRQKLFKKISFESIKIYLAENLGFGFLNLAVTLNSSMPRYLLIYNSNLRALGLFSLLYQIAATVVNIVQYPISIKVSKIASIVQNHIAYAKNILILTTLIALAIYGVLAFGVYSGADVFFDNRIRWTSYPLFVLPMLIALMFRGGMVTTLIGLAESKGLCPIIIKSMALAISISLLILFAAGGRSGMLVCGLYVALSSSVASWLMIRKIENGSSSHIHVT